MVLTYLESSLTLESIIKAGDELPLLDVLVDVIVLPSVKDALKWVFTLRRDFDTMA